MPGNQNKHHDIKEMIGKMKVEAEKYEPDALNYENDYDDNGHFILADEQPAMNVADAGVWDNGPFVNPANNIAVQFKVDQEPIGAAPPPMVGHVIHNNIPVPPLHQYANPNPNPNYQNVAAAAPVYANPVAPAVVNNYQGILQEAGANHNGYIGVAGGNHKLHPKPKLQVQYAQGEDACCDEDCGPTGYGKNVSNTRGLMVFYINTNGLAAGQALDLLDKVKAQYSKVEKTLRKDSIEVMWLPTVAGETSANYFSFR